jgi:uncharacterized membrane protein
MALQVLQDLKVKHHKFLDQRVIKDQQVLLVLRAILVHEVKLVQLVLQVQRVKMDYKAPQLNLKAVSQQKRIFQKQATKLMMLGL